ncbi:anthranilate synthase component I [Paracoccaceae bacterium GXU_MW_L88]
MKISPDYADFERKYDSGLNQILWARFPADLDTPVSLMLKLAGAGEMSFMLESVTGGAQKGRYSLIGMEPDLIWRCHGETSEINRNALRQDLFEPVPGHPLDVLRALLAESRIEMPVELPQIAAGLYGYLGYDMIRLVEHLPDVNPDVLGTPDAIMARPALTVVHDNAKGEVILCAPVWAGRDTQSAYEAAAARIEAAATRLSAALPHQPAGEPVDLPDAVSNISHEGYHQIVETAKDYIRAGDIFQVVPSQRWAQPFDLPPFSLYRALRRTNPSPYMTYFNYGDFQIVGASPETLVSVENGKVTIRPIAGTRKRGATEAEDKALEEDLLADPKELAEHLMLLDLGRNDVGKVSQTGTVTPTEKFIIERYSHVMHIVSNVEGQLAEQHDVVTALLAGLPAGTVSGAPKIRAMEIIDELETEKRGVYGGGVGYFSAGGDMNLCIALRTGVVKDKTLYIQAGGGVVYDSEPEAEFQETVNKAGALRAAAREAGRFRGGAN